MESEIGGERVVEVISSFVSKKQQKNLQKINTYHMQIQ